MAQLVVKWSKKALKKFDEKALWYLANRGETFARSFAIDVKDNVNTMSQMPGIGLLRRQEGNRTYRVFHNHPKCSILYWYNYKELHIIDLVFTQMNNNAK